MCAATLFFILSRDGMSLDVDKNAVGKQYHFLYDMKRMSACLFGRVAM